MDEHDDDFSLDGTELNTNTAVNEDKLSQSQETGDEEPKEKLTKLPMGRVRLIMKRDPSVNMVTQEALFLITKSTVRVLDL